MNSKLWTHSKTNVHPWKDCTLTFQMDKGLSGSIWCLEGRAGCSSCARIAQFTKAFQIVCPQKAGDWTGFTNSDSGKHPQIHSLSLKKVGSHDKGMAAMSLSSRSYLWHLTGSWEVHFETTYYGIGTIPGPNSTGIERGLFADGGHMGKYQAILLDNPNVTLQTTTLNLAILLPDVKENPGLQHDCLEINQVNSSRLDLLQKLLAAQTGSCTQTGAASWTTTNDESGTQ